MSKEQSHELQEQQQQQQPQEQQPQQQHEQSQTQQQQPNQQQTVPTEPEATHNHVPSQGTAQENHPPSYEQAKAAPVGQPPAAMAPGQAAATVTPLTHLGPNPQWIDCPFCHKRTKTVVRQEGGSMQFVVGAVLCFICICLACLPCMLHWFEDTEWHCSECKNRVALRQNEGPIQVCGPTQVVYSQYGQQQPMGNAQQQHPQQPSQAATGQAAQQPMAQQQQQQTGEIQPQPVQTQAQQPEHPTDAKN